LYYAIMDGTIVANIIVGPLPKDVKGIELFDRPVLIGDSLINGVFMRDGVPVLTDAERIAALEARITELEAQL